MVTMLCSNAGTAAGLQDPLGQAVAELLGEVRDLKSGGRWRTADGEGFYRVVMLRGGYEHLADRLYIQWVREGDESQPARVVASVGVTEINDNGPFTFSYLLTAEAVTRLRITVNARHGYAKDRRQFVLVATTPHSYTSRIGQPAQKAK